MNRSFALLLGLLLWACGPQGPDTPVRIGFEDLVPPPVELDETALTEVAEASTPNVEIDTAVATVVAEGAGETPEGAEPDQPADTDEAAAADAAEDATAEATAATEAATTAVEGGGEAALADGATVEPIPGSPAISEPAEPAGADETAPAPETTAAGAEPEATAFAEPEPEIEAAVVPVEALEGPGYKITTRAAPGSVFATDRGAPEGRMALCLAGAGAGRGQRISVDAEAPVSANTRELEVSFTFRMSGFGRAQIDWAVSGTILRSYALVIARAVYQEEGAEPEPVGGFFVTDVEQPLFLFENGGIYRVTITVDPVERETFPGLRQSRIIVTDLNTPQIEKVVFDSYRFFTPAAPLPLDYAGQSLSFTVEQGIAAAVWPCFESAMMIDALRFSRNN